MQCVAYACHIVIYVFICNIFIRPMCMNVYILPYMEYGDVLMSGANQVDLDKLQRLQNRGLRICLQ